MIYDAEGHIEDEDVWMLMAPRLEGTGGVCVPMVCVGMEIATRVLGELDLDDL